MRRCALQQHVSDAGQLDGVPPSKPPLPPAHLCADDLGPRDQHIHVHRATAHYPHGVAALVSQAGSKCHATRHAAAVSRGFRCSACI